MPGDEGPPPGPEEANGVAGPLGPEFERNWPVAENGTSTNTAAAQMVGRQPRFQPVPVMTGPLWCEIAANSSQGCRAGRFVGASECGSAALPRETAMPNTLDLLKTRRSVNPNELSGPAPSAAEIETLLSIAARVPDHGKLAPWRFIVFAGDARLKAGAAIAAAFTASHPDAKPEHIEQERTRLARAPLVIAVVSRAAPHVKIPEWEQVLSAGAAAMNLVVAANALGFATAWITEWYAYDRDVLTALGLAAHEKIAGFVHIGRIAHTPEDRTRPVLADLITHFGA
jgi:nitroreductase